ncbi:MAG: helicase-related protein [Myxococcales bacterium]|nr:helicase-related protein [Myxococcales bacterium]
MPLASLPIDAVRARFVAALARGPVVVAAPTGSGKSTRVPRFCSGSVLVVEPRRVACMTLARRVAEEEGAELGTTVGYQVRDDRRANANTRVLFATPGIVLRARELLERQTVILDEFHERGLETDLLLALLVERQHRGLVVMSATLEADRVASAIGGEVVEAAGRLHPVTVEYLPENALLPDPRDLELRLQHALSRCQQLPGDVLVFLPGKAEIARVASALTSDARFEVIPLHGSLSLEQQNRAFAPCSRRKLILATNVAETSVTVPGIGVVIDSGLSRRTHYHQGRSYLTLTPIAADSATQRAGRAGRTAAGVCIRLWSKAARLEATTPPEIHRESLTPMLLAAAAAGSHVERLPFLDPPKDHALDDARAELLALGALEADASLSRLGAELFGLPIDPALGRVLVEARRRDTLQDAIDLVAALGVGRPLFITSARNDSEDLREVGCDASALIAAIRQGDPGRHGLSHTALAEARRTARRLREAFSIEAAPSRPANRRALAATVLAADPRTAHVARIRKRAVAFSNGGTELELARESALQLAKLPDAVAVLAIHAITDHRGQRHLRCTAALPLTLQQLTDAGLGRERVGEVTLKRGVALAQIERVYARRVLTSEQRIPEGELARQAIAELFLSGRLLPKALGEAQLRLERRELARRAARRGSLGVRPEQLPEPIDLQAFTVAQLEALGVESGQDAALLSAEDLIPEDLPAEVLARLETQYPLRIELGDARYRAEYDFSKSRVTLHLIEGTRKNPPPRSFLPKFGGLTIYAEAGGRLHLLR